MNTPRSRPQLALFGVLALFLLTGCPGEVPQPAPQTGDAAKSSADSNATDGSNRPEAATRRIIILTNGNSPFWDAARAGMKDAASELGIEADGFQTVMEVSDPTPQGQLDKLRQFASQSDVAGVGISPVDADNAAIADAMRELQTRGVKVITIDSDVNRSMMHDARFAYIGTDNFAGGRELGVCAKKLRPEGGGYVTFVGLTGAQNAIDRIGGFAEGAGDRFESLDNMGDGTERARARDNVRNAIQNHVDKLTTLVGIWSYNAPAIVDVVREMDKRDELTVVVFDAEPIAVQQIGEGMIDAMIVQNPYQMGFQGVRLLKALAEDNAAVVKKMFPHPDEPDGRIYDTGLKVVVPNSQSPLKREHFGENTEFLTLDEFKKWLDEYGLQGS